VALCKKSPAYIKYNSRAFCFLPVKTKGINALQKQKFLLKLKHPVKAGFILWKYEI